MSYKKYIKHAVHGGKILEIYHHKDFNFNDIKEFYKNSDSEIQKKILEVYTGNNNNLFKLAIIYKDIDFALEIFEQDQNADLSINGMPLFLVLESFLSVEKYIPVENYFLRKLKEKKLILRPVNYAHSILQTIKYKYINLHDEFNDSNKFINLHKAISKNLKSEFKKFSIEEKLYFYSFIEMSLLGYENIELLKKDINSLLDLLEDKQKLLDYIVNNSGIIKDNCFYLKKSNLNFEKTEEFANDIGGQYANLAKKPYILSQEIDTILEQYDNYQINIEDINVYNFFHLRKCQNIVEALSHLQEKSNPDIYDALREAIKVFSTDTFNIINYHKDKPKNMFLEGMKKRKLYNVIVHNENLYSKELADELFSSIDKLPNKFAKLLTTIPIYVEPTDVSYEYSGSVDVMNGVPISINMAIFESSILLHELTHVSQFLYEIITGDKIEKNKLFKKIKKELIKNNNITEQELLEFICQLIDMPLEQQTERLLSALNEFIDNDSCNLQTYLYDIDKEELDIINVLFSSFKEQEKEGKSFLERYWYYMDKLEGDENYYSHDWEIHARLNEYAYYNEPRDIVHKSLTVGIKKDNKFFVKIQRLLEELNNHILDTLYTSTRLENCANSYKKSTIKNYNK